MGLHNSSRHRAKGENFTITKKLYHSVGEENHSPNKLAKEKDDLHSPALRGPRDTNAHKRTSIARLRAVARRSGAGVGPVHLVVLIQTSHGHLVSGRLALPEAPYGTG